MSDARRGEYLIAMGYIERAIEKAVDDGRIMNLKELGEMVKACIRTSDCPGIAAEIREGLSAGELYSTCRRAAGFLQQPIMDAYNSEREKRGLEPVVFLNRKYGGRTAKKINGIPAKRGD